MKTKNDDLFFVEIGEFTSYIAKERGKFFKVLEPLLGNILIIATKR